MASWLPGGGGKGGGPGPAPGSRLQTKPKKRERWLITRKTWRYMADAGKLLIPESLRKGTEEDLKFYEDQYQDACDRQQEFVIWEGPLEDPRYALAKSRKAPSISSEPSESQDSDYRYESHSAKFRIVLPPGSKPPPGYVQDVDWLSCSDINSPLDSGVISSEEFLMSPREGSPLSDDFKVDLRESGIGSGADSAVTVYTNRRNVSCQTEPLPPEFQHLLQGELKALEELKAKEDEAARIAQESQALAKREARRSSEDYDAAAMGETVMRYLKMVRRNSKSVDQKKAERFRSMNYDPTLRNIKSKYVHNAGSLDCTQHIGIQCGDSLINILKMCHTPIEPSRKKTDRRKFSLTPSDSSLCSPRYSITIADDSIPHEVERDFFSQLYGGDTPDAGNIPEEYYSYLENWYRSQVSAVNMPLAGDLPELHNTLKPPFSLQQVTTASASSIPSSSPLTTSPTSSFSSSVFIPVSALQHLRASLPAGLPHLGAAGSMCGSLPGSSMPSSLAISRSSASLAGQVPSGGAMPGVTSASGSGSGNSLSFLSSVMRSTGHTNPGKIISKKLWRQRSKSQSRATPQISSPWTPPADIKAGSSWVHVSGQNVSLQNSTLLHLLEIERVYLQKQAQNLLANSDLGTIIRIPKDICDRNEISKTRRQANLLKRKVLSAGSIVGKPQKDKDAKTKTGEGVVFGIPINQTVDPHRKRSTTDIPSDEVTSPTSKSSRSDSRTSFGSIFDSPMKDKSMERIGSPLQSSGSYESLDERSLRGGSIPMMDTLSYSSCDRLLGTGDPSDRINPQPCVPSVVTTCIRYLELHGLNTVGIFRVGSNKKRVDKLREDFDSGGDVILTDEVSVHDVATILKEFFRELPEPVLPREVYQPLLAIQKIRNRKQQIDAMRRVIQLLPQVNRDTMYVLLNFLHLVSQNSEDRQGPSGEDLTGNKMDSNNLATLFAPNILHSMKTGDGTMSPENNYKAAERTETINIVRTLIDFNKELFELSWEDLHSLYVRMNEDVPEAMDYLLRRRALLNGDEFLEEFESNVIYDMPEPRLIGPNMEPPQFDHIQDRLRKKDDDARGRARRRGSGSESGDRDKSGNSWFKFRDKSDASEASSEQSRWFKKREKSHSAAGVRSGSNESVSSAPAPAKGAKKDKGVVTGSLRINMAGLAGDKQEVDIPYIEDTSSTKPKHTSKRVVLRRLSQDSDGKMLSCEIHLPHMKGPVTSGPGAAESPYSPGSGPGPPQRGVSPTEGVFTYNVISGSNSSRGSGVSSPCQPFSPPPTIATPLVFSPPMSPFSLTPTPPNTQDMNVSVETKYLDPTRGAAAQDVSLVLKPVPPPSPRRPSPAESTKTLVNEPLDTEERPNKRSSPRPYPLTKHNLAMSSLSLPSERDNRLSAFNPEMRSKTENLERLLVEVERQGSGAASDQGGSTSSLGKREVRQYIRRRYTDSRHPTTELPDVRDGAPAVPDFPSVRDPPVRSKSKSKEVLEENTEPGVGDSETEQKRSPNIADRPSYRRWQLSSKNIADADSFS